MPQWPRTREQAQRRCLCGTEVGDEIDDLGRGLALAGDGVPHLGDLSHQRPLGSEVAIHFGTDAHNAMFHPSPAPIPGLGLLANGLWIGKVGSEIVIQSRLVPLDGEDALALVVMGDLHQVGMGMQGIAGHDPSSYRQRGEHRFGDWDLIGFLTHAHLKEGFLALMRAEREQMGSGLLVRSGPTHGLAIQGDGLVGYGMQRGLNPTSQYLLQGLDIQAR